MPQRLSSALLLALTLSAACEKQEKDGSGIICHNNGERFVNSDGTLMACELSRPVTINGVPCAEKGRFSDSWYKKRTLLNPGDMMTRYASGKLQECVLSRNHDFAGIQVPAGSRITLDEAGGHLREAEENPDVVVVPPGYRCRSSALEFNAAGLVKRCRLEKPVTIDGRKCRSELIGDDRGYSCL